MTTAFGADFDGDGTAEVVVNDNRNLYDRSQRFGRTWVLRRDPGGGHVATDAVSAEVHGCRFAADLDGDGQTDLLCSAPTPKVYWNDAGTFSPSAATALEADEVIMSAAAWDLDEDGLLDVVLSRWMAPLRVFHNLGQRRFEDVTERWGVETPALQMTWQTTFLDFDRDGHDDLYVVNDGDAHENLALRSLGPGVGGEPRFERFRPMPEEDDRWGYFGTSNASPMGVAVGDLDSDGGWEIFLADRAPGAVLSQRGGREWVLVTDELGLAFESNARGEFMVPWSPRFWDADHDGALDLLVPCGDDLGHAEMGDRGPSRLLFFQGDGRGVMASVGDPRSLPTGHFSHVALVDLDGDLDLDLILGGFGQGLRVLRNELLPAGPHLLLDLRGRASNPVGLGAVVTARVGGVSHVHLYGGHGALQAIDAPTLDLALGASTEGDELQVRWPSGYEQTVRGLAPGRRHLVEEPELFTLDPPSRHRPAGGVGGFMITVRPVDAEGAPARGAVVQVEAPFNAEARWRGPVEATADGGFRRELLSRSTPGSVALRISIDGAPLRVRPRVWFD